MVSIACAAGRQATPYRPAATAGYRGRASGASTQGADARPRGIQPIRARTLADYRHAQTYWLDLFTVETWQEFLDHGGDVTGFREKRWKTVQKIKHGDYLLCYLTGASRWVGLLEVTSEPVYDEAPIWKSDVFPSRVGIRVVLHRRRLRLPGARHALPVLTVLLGVDHHAERRPDHA
jgi:hypothetical protein